MKTKCSKYRPEHISRFVDNELFPEILNQDQKQAMTQHIKQCQHCSELSKQYRTLSAIYKNHVNDEAIKIDNALIKKKINRIMQNSGKNQWKNIFGFTQKHLTFKLACAAMILFIGIFTFQKTLFSPSGPSAIVKYVDTDFASVMIIETQKEQHTIIWLSET
jgi:hypothetical protein